MPKPGFTVKNKRPVLIIIAGPNGSGKTSITKQILQHEWVENCEYINPDDIANDQFGDWNSEDSVLKAAKLATQKRYDCLSKKQSLIFETVFSTEEKIEFIQKAKEQNYFIRLFFVNTRSPFINIKRVAQRVIEGGHDVPITKIISRYPKSVINACIASQIVDRAYFYDNSVDNVEPKLIFRMNDGRIIKQYNKVNSWTKFIKSFVEPEQKSATTN